jgi:xylan 1,4-beta-xylosidase
MFDMTDTDRYTVFGPYRKRAFDVRLYGVGEGMWQVQEYVLNRQHGSSFDKWVEMGAPSQPTPEECEWLDGMSRPMLRRRVLASAAGELHLQQELEPLEVRLVRIFPER